MTIDLNGASLYYEQHGQSGKPLLLLHGWGGKVESWLPVIRVHIGSHAFVDGHIFQGKIEVIFIKILNF